MFFDPGPFRMNRFSAGELLRNNPLASAASVLLAGGMLATPLLAQPGHEHGHHHDHTHLLVDYSFREGANAYPPPEHAGDGYYWWKGNLHTHTLWSDGDQFPEVVTQWYVEHGYHFLALSDHNVLSRGEKWINPDHNPFIASHNRWDAVDLYRERFGDDWVEIREVDEAFRDQLQRHFSPSGGHAARRPPDNQIELGDKLVRLKPLNEVRSLFEVAGRFILVEAEELTQGSHVVHVNATNIARQLQPETGETVEETIRLIVDAVHRQSRETGQPMLPHLNHPNFQWAVTAEDMAPVESLNFFEVYNGHRGVRNFGDGLHVDLERMWDIVLTRRLAELDLGIMYGLAVDDAHNYENTLSDVALPGRGWVMVRSRFLTPEHLIAALRRGDFYSTTGVKLAEIDGNPAHLRVRVDTSDDDEDVIYTIQFVGTREGYDPSREYHVNEDGEPLTRVTKRYSDDIGQVLREVEASAATYTFEGEEIYVRARVISSQPHLNPFAEGERMKAWVQPVIPGHGMLEAPKH